MGQRTRDVKCVSNIGDVVDDEECNMKLRPSDIENCDMGPCAKSWFLTEWSERVSVTCAHWVFWSCRPRSAGLMGRCRGSQGASNHTNRNPWLRVPKVVSDFGEKTQR